MKFIKRNIIHSTLYALSRSAKLHSQCATAMSIHYFISCLHLPQYVTYISAHKTTQVMQPILCRDPNNIMCMRILIPLSTEGYGGLKNGRRYSPVNLPLTEDVLILSSSTLIHLAFPCLHYHDICNLPWMTSAQDIYSDPNSTSFHIMRSFVSVCYPPT